MHLLHEVYKYVRKVCSVSLFSIYLSICKQFWNIQIERNTLFPHAFHETNKHFSTRKPANVGMKKESFKQKCQHLLTVNEDPWIKRSCLYKMYIFILSSNISFKSCAILFIIRAPLLSHTHIIEMYLGLYWHLNIFCKYLVSEIVTGMFSL